MHAPPRIRLPLPGSILAFGLIVAMLATATSCTALRSMGGTPGGDRLARMRTSPQYDVEDEHFANALGHMQPKWGEVVGRYLRNDAQTRPDKPLPRDESLSFRVRHPPAGNLRVSWIGHSTLLIEIDGHRVLTDPIFSERASPLEWVGPRRFGPPALALEELPPIDAVLISHDHYDHLDMDSIVALAATGVRFFVPLGVGAHLEHWGVASGQIVELDWWQEADLGRLRLACLPSRHFSGRGLFDRYATLWASWAVIGDEHRIYFSGDTSLTPEFLEIGRRYGPFDIAMIESAAYNPLWADSHLGPEQAVDAFLMVRGRLMVPIHWGTFDLGMHSWTEPVERLVRAAAARDVHLVVPRPGESVLPSTPATQVAWWPSLGWETAQETPIVSSNLPPLEIPVALAPLEIDRTAVALAQPRTGEDLANHHNENDAPPRPSWSTWPGPSSPAPMREAARPPEPADG